MKATEANFLSFLQKPKQFIIPIYQRPYSWTLSQCRQLWEDILHSASDDSVSGHFIGSIVYIAKGIYTVASIPQLLVIDGQQRLTTITLALSALGKYVEEQGGNGAISRKKLRNYYLLNDEEDGDLHYKLLLTQSDRETLVHLIEDRELPKPASPRVVENYRYFEEQIRKSGLDPNLIYGGFAKLVIVDIALERDHDNPQLIFESLNSTGLDLSQADLIRNYVLMGMDIKDQTQVYTDHWYPMERTFSQAQRSTGFDWFMRDYLTVKTGRIPNVDDVYAGFKEYVQALGSMTVKQIVADVYRHALYYEQFAFERTTDKELRELLGDINVLRVNVAYPFFLELFEDYHHNRVNRSELLEVLRLVESYVFRRAVCGIPANSLNKTFATLAREIDKDRYLESLRAALILKDSYRRIPDDDEFARELLAKDVYNLRSRNYLLRKLENHDRKEKVVVENYTIEHIMPQNENLSGEWRQELGNDWERIHSKYLHTLGNLTLTGYNSELSDRSFAEKRKMKGGFADSPLRLNSGLGGLAQWGEEEIIERAAALARLAVQVWPAPKLAAEVLDKHRKRASATSGTSYTLADHPKLQGEVLSLFEQLRARVLNLDASVREEIKKVYIAYKTTTNFVDVVPMKKGLSLTLNMRFDQVKDPYSLCEDLTGIGTWGNGDAGVNLTSPSQLNDAMELIRQSFELRADEDEAAGADGEAAVGDSTDNAGKIPVSAKPLKPRHWHAAARVRFWEQLLTRAKDKGLTVHANVSPSKHSWLQASAGRGLGLAYVVWQDGRTAVDLNIDRGPTEENKRILNDLRSKKEQIEAAFGGSLDWQLLDAKRASRIRAFVRETGTALYDEGGWPALQDAMIEAMDRFSKALQPHIAALTAGTIGATRTEGLAERHILRLKFWKQLLDKARAKGVTSHASISPSKENWLSTGAGKSGLKYNYLIWLHEAGVELYIDTGNLDQNKRVFGTLQAARAEIESAFGAPLEWQRLDDSRASRIVYKVDGRGLRDNESNWISVQDAMIDAMDRFVKALRPRIQALHLSAMPSPPSVVSQ